MTCNPKWPEITEALRPGQQPNDRPDIVDRVFRLKLEQLLEDITKIGVFGECAAHVYVVEFQKRGLPHAHLLTILNGAAKPHTVQDFDECVCAELPNKV